MENIKHNRSADFWLLLPWLASFAVLVVKVSGLRSWFLSNVPQVLSEITQENILWDIGGLLLVTYFSSVRWAYIRFRNRPVTGFLFVLEASMIALIVSTAQVSIMTMVFFAGCLIFMLVI